VRAIRPVKRAGVTVTMGHSRLRVQRPAPPLVPAPLPAPDPVPAPPGLDDPPGDTPVLPVPLGPEPVAPGAVVPEPGDVALPGVDPVLGVPPVDGDAAGESLVLGAAGPTPVGAGVLGDGPASGALVLGGASGPPGGRVVGPGIVPPGLCANAGTAVRTTMARILIHLTFMVLLLHPTPGTSQRPCRQRPLEEA
jgi:hypothetical protein